ncbi:hypothetical protein A4H97_13325 [Niastella yeongjuensis]|uniref:Secretion system C-terminal sorting domain-containing protein n=2 Tax=Niastella yeongjuensis TaxID=354355 RepID=A0A1V9EAF5_9BACT|nr:hypothetical protein A4H97_13325 [Niastella yeongjuensis]
MYMYAQSGTLDGSFNALGATPGYVITDIDGNNDIVKAMVVKPSDKSIYVAGYIDNGDKTLFIAHYLSDGSLDPAFGPGGVVKYQYFTSSFNTTLANAIGLQSDGTIVVGGWTYVDANRDFFVGRFNGATGALISQTYNNFSDINDPTGVDEINALVVLPDDKIVVTGITEMAATGSDLTIARYTAAGTLDNTFNNPAGYIVQNMAGDDIGNAITVDKTSGDIIVAGVANDQIVNSDFAIVRVTSAGLPVTSFTRDLFTGSSDKATAVAIDRNGNMVVAGVTNNPQDIALVRFTPAGALDLLNFGGGTGIVTTGITSTSGENVSSVIIQDDNKIVVGGNTERASGDYDLVLVRYDNAGNIDAAFGNTTPTPDGKTLLTLSGADEDPGAMLLSGDKIYFAGHNTDIVLAVFTNNNYALPLVLSSFYAQKQTSKVVLQWQTTSEEGVKQFLIQRSSDGKTFQSIGTVAATGNSSLTKNYSFADQSPFMSTSNYYRLLMQDADGNYKFSKILIIKFDGQLTTSLSVFPNPTNDVLQVQLPDGMTGTVALQIIDLNGRVIKRNNLASDGHALNTTMDVSTLIRGVYILKAQAGNTTVISRFIKK